MSQSTPRVTFYDVAADGRLPLIARLVDAAWRKGVALIVHCADEREARAIDDYLWTFKDEAFIPHELVAAGGAASDQEIRIVIVGAEFRPIDAPILVQATPTSEPFAETFETVIDIVDHRQPDLLEASRARFKAWRQRGISPAYNKR